MTNRIQLTKAEIEEFLRERGWDTWYGDDYWVNPNLVVEPTVQDYTNYGMDLKSAYAHECLKLGPFKPMGLPGLTMMLKGIDNAEKIKHFLARHSIDE
jgi:hypothetical protein